MKKIFLFSLALMSAVATFAQDDAKGTLELLDSLGNVLDDGSTITVKRIEKDDFGTVMVPSGLYVKQANPEEDLYGGILGVNIKSIDSGTLQFCFPSNCKTATKPGSYINGTTSGDIALKSATDYKKNSLQTEWLPDAYGKCTATFTIYACMNVGGGFPPVWDNIGASTSVTVNFVYDETSTGIRDLATDSKATVVARYTVDGKRTSELQKGINIVKLSNGKTVKVIK